MTQRTRTTIDRSQLSPELAERYEPLLTLAEVSAVLRRPLGTLYAEVARGRLPVVRYGRAVRVRQSTVDALLAAPSEDRKS